MNTQANTTLPPTIPTVARLLTEMEGLNVCYDPAATPATAGKFEPFPAGLHPELATYLTATFPRGLFRHQRMALDYLMAGDNTVVATRTSSGKSLIYSIPVLDGLLRDPDATALFLFPQKALANDQLQHLNATADAIPTLRGLRAANPHLFARYDGATDKDARPEIRQRVQVLITNPDMLHYSILAYPANWKRFLAKLQYVVVDECHDYRGIFGTNVSYLFRRLRALCENAGSDPTFIATSATVQDPAGHMQRLTGLPFTEVGPDQDGSSQGERKFWVVQPDGEHPYHTGRRLTLAMARAGLTVLTFCMSRTAAEQMMARAERENADDEPPFVRVYRAGLTAGEREEIECGLRNRTVRAVFSTSALELGIDIGEIDAVVCVGLPATSMSLWQRAGRAGRAGKQGAVVLIPGETPIDAYHATNPEELFERPHEPLVLSLSNERVLHLHYACAVREAGGTEATLNTEVLGPEIAGVRAARNAGTLDGEVFYLTDPHRRVRVRGTGDEPYSLVCDGNEIGQIDSFHLLHEAPRNGIYSHGGRRYRVQDVIQNSHQVRVAREFSPHVTTSTIRTSIRVRRLPLVSRYPRVVVARVFLDINDYLLGVTEKHLNGSTVRTYPGSGGMPNNWLPTEGTMLRLEPPLWDDAVASLGEAPTRAALEAIARLFKSLFPTVTGPCDASDYSASASSTRNTQPAVYLYDTVPYGVGLAVGAFDRMPDLVQRSAERVRLCACDTDEGCFQCVRNPHSETQASKSVTGELLKLIAHELTFVPVNTCTDDVGPPPVSGTCPNPKCLAAILPAAKFCSNCGTELEPVS